MGTKFSKDLYEKEKQENDGHKSWRKELAAIYREESKMIDEHEKLWNDYLDAERMEF